MRPSVDQVLQLFRVDLDAGRLYWRRPPKQHPRLLATEAGSIRVASNGRSRYCYVKVQRQAIKRAHVIFAAAHGRWPAPLVDHRNRNPLDDRIANLREATVLENNRNHPPRRKRSRLPRGVKALPSGRFQARIGLHGRSLSLGSFATPAEASVAYEAKRKEVYGHFA